jgi:hypothetical protein
MVEVSIQTDPYDPTSLDDLGGPFLGSLGSGISSSNHNSNTIQLSVENSAGEPVIAQVPASLPAGGGLVADPLPPATVDDMTAGGAGGGGGGGDAPNGTRGSGQDEAAVASALTELHK